MSRNQLSKLVFILTCLLIFYSCDKDEIETFYSDQYLFLEQYKHTQSTLLEGGCGILMFDFPTYWFNPSTGVLTDFSNKIEMNKSIQLVVGTGSSASGDAMRGAATGLMGIQNLPTEYYGVVVTKLDEDGTVYFNYKDSTFVLSPNEEWLNTSTEIITDINRSNGDTIGIVKYTYSDRITNWGFLPKESFIGTDDIEW